MSDKKITQKGIEQGRANFAYQCAVEGKEIKEGAKYLERYKGWYKDDKYSSYVRKIPMLIKNNGLGATFSFVLAKRKKENEQGKPGTKENPKNGYDLIYNQTTNWFKQDANKWLNLPLNKEFVEIIIGPDIDSTKYRAITVEVLSFFNWLGRFAEGLIKEEEHNE